MTALDSSSQCLQSFMTEHNLATATCKAVKVRSATTGVANVCANLTLLEDDAIDVLQEHMDLVLPAADHATATRKAPATTSATRSTVNAPAEVVCPDDDATSANQVTSGSLIAPSATATVTPTYATRIPVLASSVPATLSEPTAKCARKVTMATPFWEATTSANHACAPTDQEATDSLLTDAEKTTSSTELFATAWKDMQARDVTSALLPTGEILTNRTACAANANATTTSTHSTHKRATPAPESAPAVCTTPPDLTAKDAATSTTEVPSISAVKLAPATCWEPSDLLASVISAAVMLSLDNASACPTLSEECATSVHQTTGNWPAEKGALLATAIHSTQEDFHATSTLDNVNVTMVSEDVHVTIALMVSTANPTDSATLAIATRSVPLPANATVSVDSALASKAPVDADVTSASVDSLDPYQTANPVVNVSTTGTPSLKNSKLEHLPPLLLPNRSVKLESLALTTKNSRKSKLGSQKYKLSTTKLS